MTEFMSSVWGYYATGMISGICVAVIIACAYECRAELLTAYRAVARRFRRRRSIAVPTIRQGDTITFVKDEVREDGKRVKLSRAFDADVVLRGMALSSKNMDASKSSDDEVG